MRFLNRLEDFVSSYSAIGAGIAVGAGGNASSFQNNNGVVFSLKQKTTGLALDLGVRTGEVTFKK